VWSWRRKYTSALRILKAKSPVDQQHRLAARVPRPKVQQWELHRRRKLNGELKLAEQTVRKIKLQIIEGVGLGRTNSSFTTSALSKFIAWFIFRTSYHSALSAKLFGVAVAGRFSESTSLLALNVARLIHSVAPRPHPYHGHAGGLSRVKQGVRKNIWDPKNSS